MPECKKCGAHFPSRLRVGDKHHNLQNRKYCFDCSPFGSKNTRDLTQERKTRKRFTEEGRQKQVEYIRNRREEFRKKARESKGGACQICGYDKCHRALEFHHIDPNEKLFAISPISYRMSWEVVQSELDKCILLCANCHREVEAGMTLLPVPLPSSVPLNLI